MTSDVLPAPTAPDEWSSWVRVRDEQPAVIAARGLGVRFTAGGGAGIRARVRRALRGEATREVWALRDVDLTVHAGECLAIIGRNGAGKSTLLRVVARLIDHDTGSVRVRGRVSALLNLGVGFDPLLTGGENVMLVGSLMGLTRAEIRDRLEEVISFADIGAAINSPLRTYSSGMRARLGFATAATMIEPHVLLLDEVMGTGDAAFRERSRERVMDLVSNAHAVVVTSHDMAWVAEFASYAVLLDEGRVVAEGAPGGVTTLHRARAVKPPRRYGCDACGGDSTDGFCNACGVWRRS